MREQHGTTSTCPTASSGPTRGASTSRCSARRPSAGRARGHDPSEREHVTPYLYAGPHRLPHPCRSAGPEDRSSYRVTLDTVEDLELIRRLLEDHGAASLDCDGVIAVLDHHPELVALNADVAQRELG